MAYFPMMVKLEGKLCLVIGGGEIGQRKAEALLEAGADVTVVSPVLTERLQAWADAGRLRCELREYRQGDAAGCVVVVAATNRPEVNASAAEHIRQGGGWCWVDIVDQPELSTFMMPSVVRRGDLLLAVSTSGASPTLARSIRDRLLEEYGPEYAACLRFMREIRADAKRLLPDSAVRQRFLRRVMSGDDVHERIRSGQWKVWSLRVREELQELAERQGSSG